jgi:hypothetical protein
MSTAAWSILSTSIATFLTAAAAYLRARSNGQQNEQQLSQLKEVHVSVNSRLDNALARVVQLTDALETSGTIVPDTPPSKEVPKDATP